MDRSIEERTSLSIAYATWRALFLRESVNRLLAGRAAWLWILLEPVIHIVFILFIFTVVRMRTIGGIDAMAWLMVGMLAFFVFRRTATQGMNAIDANRALFTYRQVRPVDTVIVRAMLEGFLMSIVAFLLFAGAAVLGKIMFPADPLLVIASMFGLWLLALGFGLMASVANTLVSELGKLLSLSMMPLYFLSGVIFPLSTVPQPYRSWLMLNPVAHGLESARVGFAPYYHAVAETDLGYLFGWALLLLFLGLALHVRYSSRMVAL